MVIPSNFGLKYSIISKYPSFEFKGYTFPFLLAIIHAGSICIQLYTSYCGVLLTDDSRNYLSAARSFASSGEFLSPDGSYFVAWPPLFPVLLSWTSDPLPLWMIINVLLKIAIGLFIYLISTRFISNRSVQHLFTLACLWGVHLTMISAFLWSELLFLLLLLINFMIAVSWKNSVSKFAMICVTGFLLCLQRNAGVFYIASIFFWMLLDQEVPMNRRLLAAFAFAGISLSGWAIWMMHIHSVSDEFNFAAFHFFEDPIHNAFLISSKVGKLWLPGPGWLTSIAGVMITASLCLFLWREIRQRRALQLLILIIVIYSCGLWSLGQLNSHDLDRLISVVVPLLYLLGFVAIDKLVGKISLSSLRIAVIGMILWSFYPLGRTVQNARLWHNQSCYGLLHK
jgi:hypothetical protein